MKKRFKSFLLGVFTITVTLGVIPNTLMKVSAYEVAVPSALATETLLDNNYATAYIDEANKTLRVTALKESNISDNMFVPWYSYQSSTNYFEGYTIIFEGTVKNINSKGMNLFSLNSRKSITSLILQDGIEVIGSNAFTDFSGLTNELIIPDSVTDIGMYAFTNCINITGLKLSSNLNSIGSRAFENTDSLEYIDFNNLGINIKVADFMTSDTGQGLWEHKFNIINGENISYLDNTTPIDEDAFINKTRRMIITYSLNISDEYKDSVIFNPIMFSYGNFSNLEEDCSFRMYNNANVFLYDDIVKNLDGCLTFNKPYLSLVGWYSTEDFSGKVIDKYSSPQERTNKDFKLYAKVKDNSTTIIVRDVFFDKSGVLVDTVERLINKKYDEAFNYECLTFDEDSKYAGYSFAGSYTNSNSNISTLAIYKMLNEGTTLNGTVYKTSTVIYPTFAYQEQEPEYVIVSIPAEVTLDYDSANNNFSVTDYISAYGNIVDTDKFKVTVPDTITFTSAKGTATGNVSIGTNNIEYFSPTELHLGVDNNALATKKPFTVSVPDVSQITSGSYSAVVTFNYDVVAN